MKKGAKVLLIIAALLVLIGAVTVGFGLILADGDFSKLSTFKYETNTYEIGEDFENIVIDTDTADIAFAKSEDGKCRVVLYERENVKHSATVKDGTLKIEENDTRKWYEHIGINFTSPRITVYLPKSEYALLTVDGDTGDTEIPGVLSFGSIQVSVDTGDINCFASVRENIGISTDTGDVFLDGVKASAISITTTTGDVYLSGVNATGGISVNVTTGEIGIKNTTCGSFTSHGSTGDITLTDTVAYGILVIERSTGEVKFNGADAAEIYVTTDTGDVDGSLLTDKVFIVKSDTGDIEVPRTQSGGRCEITTDTGDIEITVGRARN